MITHLRSEAGHHDAELHVAGAGTSRNVEEGMRRVERALGPRGGLEAGHVRDVKLDESAGLCQLIVGRVPVTTIERPVILVGMVLALV